MGKGLPKKYARMGFKRGWKAYRKTKRGRKRKSPVRRTTTKRRRGTTARRRYTRRRGRTTRRSITIPIGGIGIAASTFMQLRGDRAMGNLLQGDVQGAIQELGSNSVTDVVAASIPPLVYGMVKKAMGPVELFKIGRLRITI